MVTAADLGPISSQYAAAATVPLIKSPSLWLPKPIEMPNDIHPLPEDITAYFVYPFTLEDHVLSVHPSPSEVISQRRARNAEILHKREVEEEQKEKEALRKIAPGYNPSSVLLPSASNTPKTAQSIPSTFDSLMQNASQQQSNAGTIDPMDDLVSQLEEMEAKK
ncbi:hypothetical protein L486_01767 [Kwoniella mangroviensis CBS 10435]|uniref:Uncharacterized protein n=1 Tax=Kwoniella mangroviensis CBS 10435 TaxID=1331196 RepID=A0A1B9J2U0_9TREE|nr:uncharacterized protein I203_03567 [Kwoniella mangroviensis CBS 8507]OCF62101.1 hypothetical protein L486_01767 [Kwoniella mangroviensis CBS 10435]OCF66885.1 hypothetical protein I203_03567 [Kwoniella mangroviensis CBS 8507]OCF73327.1 hypothetical protein I204_06559 [Kwoniella mangroviensis CBS 8886]